MYVKENNIWNKDDSTEKINKIAVKKAIIKNINKFKEWIDADPQRSIPDTREYNFHIQIMGQCINTGPTKNENNIITNIAKNVYLNKNIKNSFAMEPPEIENP